MSTSEGQHRRDGLERKREASIRWFGHVQRKDDCYIGILTIELPGKTKWGRPKRKFMDAVREDMAMAEVTDTIHRKFPMCQNLWET